MPKAILSFKLPEEAAEFELAQKAGAYHSMIWEIQQYVRTLRKYDGRSEISIEELASKIHEITSDFEP